VSTLLGARLPITTAAAAARREKATRPQSTPPIEREKGSVSSLEPGAATGSSLSVSAGSLQAREPRLMGTM